MVWLQLIRWKNLVLIGLSQILIVWKLYGSHCFELPIILYIICTFCIAASGNVINDVFDVVPDQINKPNKVIVEKSIPKKKVVIVYKLLNIIGVILSLWASILLKNKALVAYTITITLLLYFYSKNLKGIAIVGNIFIALFTSLSLLLFLSIFNSNAQQKIAIYTLSAFCFLTNWAREMVKDIEDIKGDQKANLKTLPIIVGTKRTVLMAKTVITILLSSSVLLMYVIPFGYLKTYLFVAIIIPIAYSLQLLTKACEKKDFSMVSKILKIIIGLGVFSIFLF